MAEQAINVSSTDTDEKPVILIADDSRVVRVSLKNILKKDCHLIEAEDGQQAWELLLEHPHVQLIFSDLSMPRLDGRGLLKKIRQSEITRVRNLPFIVVTGNEENSDIRRELQESGATEIVTKPFDPASIISYTNTLASKQESESYFILPDEDHQTELLPGISSQSNFMEVASKELSFAIRNKNELAIALLKIDRFDSISHHYSGPAVEHILLATAEIIHQHIHPDDTMAYFGEGLYAILRPASNAIGTRYIGRRIIEDLVAKQFYLGETDDAVSASIGISAPQIKHGTRLRELLLLAEGRLKAAMDLGGNRVIDKGNDTLTPVSFVPDSSQDSANQSSLFTQPITSGAISSQQAAEEIASAPSNQLSSEELGQPGEAAKQIAELQKQMEQLSHDNKDLQSQVERWRKQSAESEQLRQRVFELESEQQQMQLKLTDLQTDNHQLHLQSEATEQEKQLLIENDEERLATLKQANQFYEEENLRLEGQLDALNNRAQKAELAYRNAEQLNTSLKDNISLLRGQLEQIQQQLSEAQHQAVNSAPKPEHQTESVDSKQEPADSHISSLNEPTESELIFNGFPSTTEGTPREKAPVLQIFPEKDPTPAPMAKPVPVEPKQPEPLSIPAYRTNDEKLPRERRSLSSFAIASLILLILLGLGSSYLYRYLQQTPEVVAQNLIEESQTPAEQNTQSEIKGDTNLVSSQTDTAASSSSTSVTPDTQPSPVPTSDIISEEAKLQAELTLRQMAEEEYNQQLLQINGTSQPSNMPEETQQYQSEEADSEQPLNPTVKNETSEQASGIHASTAPVE